MLLRLLNRALSDRDHSITKAGQSRNEALDQNTLWAPPDAGNSTKPQEQHWMKKPSAYLTSYLLNYSDWVLSTGFIIWNTEKYEECVTS